MKQFFKKFTLRVGLKTKFMLILLLIGTLPLFVLSRINLKETLEVLGAQAINQLVTARDTKKRQVITLFENLFDQGFRFSKCNL